MRCLPTRKSGPEPRSATPRRSRPAPARASPKSLNLDGMPGAESHKTAASRGASRAPETRRQFRCLIPTFLCSFKASRARDQTGLADRDNSRSSCASLPKVRTGDRFLSPGVKSLPSQIRPLRAAGVIFSLLPGYLPHYISGSRDRVTSTIDGVSVRARPCRSSDDDRNLSGRHGVRSRRSSGPPGGGRSL